MIVRIKDKPTEEQLVITKAVLFWLSSDIRKRTSDLNNYNLTLFDNTFLKIPNIEDL